MMRSAKWMMEVCMPSQCCTLLEGVFKGLTKLKAVNDDRLGDFHQQIHCIHSRKILHIKRESISYP